MKLGFDITPYRLGREAGLYTVRLQGSDVTELNLFLSDPRNQANADFKRLVRYLFTTPDQGYREGRRPETARFRDEDDVSALSVAHPDPKVRYPPSLRLFCLRYQDVVILGSGGVKARDTEEGLVSVGTLKEFRAAVPEANRAYRIMQQVVHRFEARRRIGETTVNGTRLGGNLIFDSDDIP